MVDQGAIYGADLSPGKGHEQKGYRPVLVLQNNILNTHLSTVIIAPLTSSLEARGKLTTLYLSKEKTGLSKDSVVLLHQIRAVDKIRLKKKISSLSKESWKALKEQLWYVF